MKAVVGTFNQEKALVGAFSVIVQLHRLIGYSTTAAVSAVYPPPPPARPIVPLISNETNVDDPSNTDQTSLFGTNITQINQLDCLNQHKAEEVFAY